MSDSVARGAANPQTIRTLREIHEGCKARHEPWTGSAQKHDRPLVNGSSPCGHLHRHPDASQREGCMACFDAGLDFDYCRVCGRGEPSPCGEGCPGCAWCRERPGDATPEATR